MKLQPNYEVARPNILNRKTLSDMDIVLNELLLEETSILTQAKIEGKKDIESVFLAYKSGTNDFSHVQCNKYKEYRNIVSHCKKITL